jgi:hypothetical protein
MKPELIDVVRKLKYLDNEMDAYLNTVPSDIGCVIFDNGYVNSLYTQKELLINALFGDMAEDVSWFLFDFQAGKSPGPHCITKDGKEYFYHTDEDYYDYLKDQE